MKEKVSKKWLLLLFLGLAIIFIGVYFLFIKDKSNSEENSLLDDSRVISKQIDFALDEMGFLIVVADIKLSESLTEDNVVIINIDAYDSEDKLLHSYVANSRYFDIKDIDEIHLGFDDNTSTDLNKIEYLKTKVEIEERTADPNFSYEFVVEENPEVVQFMSLYRVFLDLDDEYISSSGFAKLEYENGHKEIKRISYLDGTDYIGVSEYEDFSYKDNSLLDKISVYKINMLKEIN